MNDRDLHVIVAALLYGCGLQFKEVDPEAEVTLLEEAAQVAGTLIAVVDKERTQPQDAASPARPASVPGPNVIPFSVGIVFPPEQAVKP